MAMQININPYANIVPKIYAYTTPEIASHDGWTKIGYTEQDSVRKRIEQQTKTADVRFKAAGSALYGRQRRIFYRPQFP